MNQALVRMLYGFASCALLLGTVQAKAGTVVTDNVISTTRQAQTNVPVTFGQIFKAGDVPRGATITATLDSHPVTLQVDAKATNPDGSLRHAVLTAMIPPLRGKAKLPLALAAAPTSSTTESGALISLSQLLATTYSSPGQLDTPPNSASLALQSFATGWRSSRSA